MYPKKYLSVLILFLLIVSGCVSSQDAYLKEKFDQIRPLEEEDLAIREFHHDLPPLIAAAKSDDFRAVARLLEAGEDMEKRDPYGRSALWYAFEHASFESFRLLLENGAKADFPLSYGTPSDRYEKLRFYSLAREYALYNRIKDFENSNDIQMFDAYFSEFPNGHYAAETESMFRQILERDYEQMKDSAAGAKQFMEKYAGMGKHAYLITANVLNIREGNSIKTGKKGQYIRGQVVFVLSQRGDWLRTDRGWISAKYAKRVTKQIPVLTAYLEKIAPRLPPEAEYAETGLPTPREDAEPSHPETVSQDTEAFERKKALRKPSLPDPEPEHRKVQKKNVRVLKASHSESRSKEKAGPVQAELDALLENATLPALEAFISKYKKNRAYRAVVEQARDAYKRILLGTE